MPTIFLEGVSVGELEALIQKTVARGIDEALKLKHFCQPPTPPLKYLTRTEVAKRLSISLPTLKKYVYEGILPCYHIGSRVLFKEHEIDEALQGVQTSKYKKRKVNQSLM